MLFVDNKKMKVMLRSIPLAIVLIGIVELAGCGGGSSSSNGNNNSDDITPPTVPANLIATAVSSMQIDLSWDASSDNEGVSGYSIYREGTEIATATGTNYSDNGLMPSTTYSYTVTAFDTAGNESGTSSSMSATTQASSGTTSNLFPPYENAPALTRYVSDGSFNNTYYISPTGNDATGDGSINNPWASLSGPTAHCSSDLCPESTIQPGDIIYFRGGVYSATPGTYGGYSNSHFNARERELNSIGITQIRGEPDNYIIITAYPGETPIFEGVPGGASFSIHTDYVVIDGLTFTSGGFYINGGVATTASNIIIQNNEFGACTHLWGSQINPTCIGLQRQVSNITIRNNYFGPSNAHSVKEYQSVGIVDNVKIIYNRIYNNTDSYGAISFKGATSNWEIAYNKFEDALNAITYGTTYAQGTFDGFNIHHNVFDNVYRRIIERLGVSTGEIVNLKVHNNIVLNASSNNRDLLMLRCTENGCMNNGIQAMGEFYNNAFYGLTDIIDPQITNDFTNYPSYWNYNAYPGIAVRDSAENQNSLSSLYWQGSALIQENHGIIRSGEAGNRFYTITNDSSFIGAGRYGDNIGGFTFGSL